MRKHQLCGVVVGPSHNEAKKQLLDIENQVDCIEIRVDMLQTISVDSIHSLIKTTKLPIIITVRCLSQGGSFSGTEKDRLEWIRTLANLEPDSIDLESHLDPDFTAQLKQEHPNIEIICSFHHFEKTPHDLHEIYQNMQRHHASIYKIVTYATHVIDALRMLQFVKKCDNPIIGFCMGEEGSFTHAIAPILGSCISYGAIDKKNRSAPGQFSIDELTERFRIREVTPKTKLLGLIGNPVDRSESKETHHRIINALGLDAIYVQMRVSKEQLQLFVQFAKEIGFHGLSVTMPHKKTVAEMINSKEGAINTIQFTDDEKIIGCNTDGIGALKLLQHQRSIHSSHIVLLGAGGAACGIAEEAIRQGARVTVLNRTVEKAMKMANAIGCAWGDLNQFEEIAKGGYDILINAIPAYDFCPVDPEHMLPNKVCLEVVSKPQETPFYLAAQNKNCVAIPGIAMFLEQAKEQFSWWFKK